MYKYDYFIFYFVSYIYDYFIYKYKYYYYKVKDRFYTKFEGKGTWQSDMIKRYQKYKGIIVIEPSPQPLYKPPLSSFHNNPIDFQSSKPNFLFSHRSFFPLFFFRSTIFFILCKCITYDSFMYFINCFCFDFNV